MGSLELDRVLREKFGKQSFSLGKIIDRIVSSAQRHSHGCTIVIDPRPDRKRLRQSGEVFTRNIDLSNDEYLELAKRLSKIDGALYLNADGKLASIGYILYGPPVQGEKRSRGARYTSALRFTRVRTATIVIAVSEDGPVSVFSEGKELSLGKRGRLQPDILSPESIESVELSRWCEEE